MQRYESWVEKQIREATERGDFDDLPGAGRPLTGLDDPDPDWWAKRKMAAEGLDTADVLPPALQLRRERAGYPESLLDLTSEDAVRAVLRDYNARVVDERRRPVVGPIPPVLAPTVDVDEVVGQWRELRDRRAAAPPEVTEGAAERVVPAPRRRWWRRG
ncbi:DnaJ family domain-containing protein [Janibacter melonis]|uniref:DnaJ family domain-containing protein n=1 Tax=Janibacter melonis TaxID=262209 RepID=UPI00174AAA95|nr:DUF1992 domain-containing protein [Janibacter melonis]